MHLELIKSDIRFIGDSVCPNDKGNCVFVFYGDHDAYGIEYIFLRNLLKLFGEQYRIISEDEYIDEKDEISICLTTNLPWKMYCEELEQITEYKP